ncbi:uncharacterized protein TNCV_243711 [Trichonephila clavipes]|nr:uncharacterized protein TNCV_243711 [Trichonephila clavipes]
MVMSETHSEKRKFGKAGESSANKKARREVSKKYGKFTEDCIPDGVFPIGDDVFVFASTYYDSASVHIRRFKKYGKTYYPTPEGITLDPRWIEYIMRKKKVPESLEELPSGLFPPERHIQITSENFIDFTFKRIKYGPDKEPTFKEITISREQWAEMIEKYGAIENAAIDNMFQCMDFLTAYKTFCEGPIENTLPSSLDVSLGQQYLTQILKKSICSLLNEKGLKQPQTFAEELWGNREETFNSYVSSLEANEIADCFYHNFLKMNTFIVKICNLTQEFLKNLLDIILRENRRDQSQITHLGRQLYPRKVKFFKNVTQMPHQKPYGYLLIDLKPETDESLRVRTEEKTILYLQVLQKYTHFSNENRRESESVRNEKSLSENQETESLKDNLKESVVKTEKEVFEDEIFRIVPARYKEKAKNIFQFLKLQESFSWNSDGEIIYKNTVIPGSNIAFLVNDFLRNRKSAPEGRYVFLRALNDVNLPKNLDVNKKLYQNNKIIKKPIMYARRNAWLKL